VIYAVLGLLAGVTLAIAGFGYYVTIRDSIG
jgi:hypothetical protein